MRALPFVMVAPNGGRLTKADHPAIPITVAETVDVALACRAAGADGLHAHVRSARGEHVLDAGLYAELLAELATKAPDFYVQITTEAVGRYTPAEQRGLVERLRPEAVSIALREITSDQPPEVTRDFLTACQGRGTQVQHILYDLADIDMLARLVESGIVPSTHLAVLLVLGRYSDGQISAPSDLDPMAARLTQRLGRVDWAVCAFGPHETACLARAKELGGKARVGFENNRTNADGTIAATNVERVQEVIDRLTFTDRIGS